MTERTRQSTWIFEIQGRKYPQLWKASGVPWRLHSVNLLYKQRVNWETFLTLVFGRPSGFLAERESTREIPYT